MSFADPWLLWVVAPLYALWVAFWIVLPRRRRRRGLATGLRFSSVAPLLRAGPRRGPRLRRAVQGLRLVTVALVLIAMAGPRTGREMTQISSQGIDIVLVLDASGSMQALDLDADRPIQRRRHRLAVAKDVVREFVAGREHDRLGLVVFGAEAYTQCPLTLDRGILSALLDRIEIGVAGDRTAIGAALGTAVKRLQSSAATSKVVILLTDGRNNAGAIDPQAAAEAARALGVRVYTIGAGTRGRAPFLVDSVFGPRVVRQHVEIDEEQLQQVAAITGGKYFRAEDEHALERIYEEIDRLERSPIEERSYVEYEERFPWLVAPAVGLLLIEVGVLGTRLRKLP